MGHPTRMYYFINCFGFQTLDDSVKQAETGQSKEEKNGDKAELYHALHGSGEII